MKQFVITLCLIVLFGCKSDDHIRSENSRLRAEVQNLQAHANSLQEKVDVQTRIANQCIKRAEQQLDVTFKESERAREAEKMAEQNLNEAARQRVMAEEATARAQQLAAELAKCKGQ